MRAKSRQDLYFKLSDSKKHKKRIEWCMRILREDIDKMPAKDFYVFVEEYECLIAFPEHLGYYFFGRIVAMDGDIPVYQDTKAVKTYQKAARSIMVDLRKMEPLSWTRFDAKMSFKLRVSEKSTYKIIDADLNDFEYSYGRRLSQLVEGKRFDEVIKTCPVCGHYFVILSKHGKECCSHGCSQKQSLEKKKIANPTLVKRQRNIRMFFYNLRRNKLRDERIRKALRNYINERNYKREEIPRNIERFLKR